MADPRNVQQRIADTLRSLPTDPVTQCAADLLLLGWRWAAQSAGRRCRSQGVPAMTAAIERHRAELLAHLLHLAGQATAADVLVTILKGTAPKGGAT